MSNSYHFHGKWTVGKKVPTAVYAGNDSPVCICDSMGETLSGTDAANARRIVACVNAFDGLSTDLLEAMADGLSNAATLIQESYDLKGQRDQLLAALEHLVAVTTPDINGQIGSQEEHAAALYNAHVAITVVKAGAQ